MWAVTSQKTGISALGLQRELGLRSYKTAWAWLHKLRRAMVRPGRDRLTGRVEVDEAYIGGLEEGVRGRQTAKKPLIAVAAEEDGEWIGRIRMCRIPRCDGPTVSRRLSNKRLRRAAWSTRMGCSATTGWRSMATGSLFGVARGNRYIRSEGGSGPL
jgi:hypothetical protein